MIQATITRSRSNKDILSFEMSGHANFAEHGQDLVCAGASAVAFGAVNAVIKLTGIEPVIDLGEDGGLLVFKFPDETDREAFEKAQLLLEGMIVSLETIERDYKGYLKVTTNKI
ncbi:ribosomal-processing cysteine protease Prp [Bacillus swezeyi]|uniref:Ribosomal processing cysteine protease Prp n=1 Tax=Bacillus swezeyi TaxID=1925020 RepID=A0A1R1RKC0_9BACI|nr:ribosomal-processing cysteine protease Prp [Bacillus swezeyi]MEC1262929.1 ribosomal-processing cysteine protease Prp [Bacillus swezeyi]MED1739997.1 ribosomal-processing cysteine protease Prp [Bacillus swezeyi]MED2928212.1 ribosomal-processing cysteine protease Prp [Bacillus swezeyi]MED2940893.1 ribosomal-processing cysteine protease Prp [Bacillus swezeyi]MED2966327.1 ribosomal-processing cysteine protease Prp [Bacillus swezeyi]